MVKVSNYTNYSKIWNRPKNPYEKLRLCNEIRMINFFGLKNKRELWRTQFFLSKLRKVAEKLIYKKAKLERIPTQSYGILWFCYKYNFMNNMTFCLESIIKIDLRSILSRRLQTVVKQLKLSKTIHEARILIMHKHIQVKNQIVNKPSFLVRKDNEIFISFSLNSIHFNLNKKCDENRIIK